MAKWINSSLPTTSFPCMLPTNFTFGRSSMFSLLLARLPIPADILEVQHRAMNRMDHVEFNPEMLLIILT